MGGRGFGTAMESLFNYLGSEFGNTFALGMHKYITCIYSICFNIVVVGSVLWT